MLSTVYLPKINVSGGLSAAQDILADFISLFRKLFFIFSHDISGIHGRIMMEVIGNLGDFKCALRSFFHCEVKEAPVICFEFDDTSLSQNLVIPSEIFGGGKAASGMSFLGPGIGKVEIDFFYLPFRKIGVDQLRVSADKKQVLKLQFLLLFQTSQKKRPFPVPISRWRGPELPNTSFQDPQCSSGFCMTQGLAAIASRAPGMFLNLIYLKSFLLIWIKNPFIII